MKFNSDKIFHQVFHNFQTENFNCVCGLKYSIGTSQMQIVQQKFEKYLYFNLNKRRLFGFGSYFAQNVLFYILLINNNHLAFHAVVKDQKVK